MKIYNAIMRAADRVEATGLYDFYSTGSPEPGDCGTPACMLGWIGYELGMYRAINAHIAQALGLTATGMFYGRIVDIASPRLKNLQDPIPIAKAMRAYAQKYHAPKRESRPNSALVADLMTRVLSERIPEDA